jgi:3-hydroxyisobutyrate dehydrogenase-like beta-hydroxyacid dehydrogenase
MQNVGFMGLGTTRTPMAWNVHRAGYRLGAYNRSEQRAIAVNSAGVDSMNIFLFAYLQRLET